MDSETLEILTRLNNSIVRDDWKKSLDALFVLFRKIFVFDKMEI